MIAMIVIGVFFLVMFALQLIEFRRLD